MSMQLLETYHGVHIAVTYHIAVTCERGFGKRTLDSTLEFVVSCPNSAASDQLKASIPYIYQYMCEILWKSNIKPGPAAVAQPH